MKAFVAVTDNDWFRFLSRRRHLDEANFWQPGGSRQFRALARGQPFLFKLHAPHDAIVGGGFCTHSSLLPSRLAWDAFGEMNGASTYEEMRRRIRKYRRVRLNRREEYVIGCILLQDLFFFEPADWLAPPPDFRRTIVQGKTYDLRTSPGRDLWESVRLRLQKMPGGGLKVAEESPATLLDLTPSRRRLGQGSFRVLVTDTYGRRCAVSGEKALPVLQAAHIVPVSRGGRHALENGLLLRSDIHALFDQGYVTVTPEYRFLVSQRIRDDFDDGESYYLWNQEVIRTPRRLADRPSREFLEWHADSVFLG